MLPFPAALPLDPRQSHKGTTLPALIPIKAVAFAGCFS